MKIKNSFDICLEDIILKIEPVLSQMKTDTSSC